MRTYLNVVVGAGAVVALLATWTGCSSTGYKENRPLIYQENSYNTEQTAANPSRVDVPHYQKAEAPASAPKPAPPQKPTECGASQFVLKSDLLQLEKRVPARATLGQQVENDIIVTPLANCADVVITDTIPDGGTYVKSEPNATVEGKKLTWRMETLDKGSQVSIKVWYTADREGCLVNCATMAAIPRGCAATLVGMAKLTITCSLPANARVGTAVEKTIEVKNVGTAPATGVVVTDTLPEGLSSATGERTLTLQVGDLAPNESKQLTVPLKAEKRGPASDTAVAKGGNAGEVKSECATVINQPGLNITKEGTKEQFLGRNATYNIVVSNTGDTELQNVVVTDTAPAETKIVQAEGGSVSGNTATWKMASIAKDGKETLGLVLTSMTPGSHCNNVSVTSAEGLSANAQACTLWKGVPAILLETKDDPDPVGVGEKVVYTITVTNQGTADDNNIKVVARFAKEVDPVSADRGGTIDGKTVTFAVVPSLAPKQVMVFTIDAKGVAPGDHRLKVELTSDMLTEPVTHEESTHVY